MSTSEVQMPMEQIPVPDDFPVHWDDPAEERMMWEHDRMHNPDPESPLEFSVANVFNRSMDVALAHYEMPLVGHRAKRINTFTYSAMIPFIGTPEEMAAREKAAMEKLIPAVLSVGSLWRDKLLPEVKSILDRLAAVDLAAMTPQQLADHIDEMLDDAQRLFEIHFLIVFPAYLAVGEFDEMYKELFPSDDPFAAFKLLAGQGNKTVETGEALWRLSRLALAAPEVAEIIRSRASEEVLDALEASDAGRRFASEFRAYVEEYGQRGDKFGFEHPFWVEDPTPVVNTLRDYLEQPDDADPTLELERQAAERDRLLSDTRSRLQGYPQPVREQFEAMLKAATDGLVITEDHGFYIDFAGFWRVRRVLVEAGRRLAEAKVIASPDDAFMLTLEELQESLRSFPGPNRHVMCSERAAEMERWQGVQPPPVLGAMPPEPPPDNPFTRTLLGKFFGRPVEQSAETDVVLGNPGSAGKVTGRARVIRSITEASRLEAGDVLLSETTAPPWTPLFAVASAIVTDTGGVLSHAAVVAREYGIPAVVGTGIGTTVIHDGQLVEVDGDAGMVRILSEA